MAEGIRAPNVPLGTDLSHFLGLQTEGSTQSLRRFTRSEVIGAIETIADSFVAGGGIIFTTVTQAAANLGYAANVMAWVVQDPIAGNNGVYQKTGASGSGGWVRRANLPYSFYRALNAGSGTANAIVAASASGYPIPSNDALIVFNATAENTSSTVTVAFNGGAPLTIKTSSGNAPAVGGFLPNMLLAGYIDGSNFRLLTDLTSAAIQAAAENAAALAQTMRDAAQDAADAAIGATGIGLFATKAAAEATTIPAGTKQIRLASYLSVIMIGGAWPLATRVATGSSSNRYQLRSQDRFLPDGSTDSSNGGWWQIVTDRATPFMFGAVADGTTDDTAAVQACFDCGASEIYLPQCPASFVVGQLSPQSHQTIRGPGLLQQKVTGANVFYFTGKTNIKFDGVRIRGIVPVSSGYSTPASTDAGIRFQTSSNIKVINCEFSRLRYLAALAEGSTDVFFNDNLVFENCFGMRFTGVTGGSMRGNTVRDTCMWSLTPLDDNFNIGLALDSTDGHSFGLCRDITIGVNRIKKLGHAQAILIHGGIGVTVTGNRISDCGQGIACSGFNSADYLGDLAITGNSVTGGTGYTMPAGSGEFGISVQGSPGGVSPPNPFNIVIDGNQVANCNRNYLDASNGGIRIGYTERASVTGNTVIGCGGCGIVLSGPENGITVTGNTIGDVVATSGGQQIGIYVIGVSRGIIASNLLHNLSGTNGTGIYYGASNAIVEGENRFYNCTHRSQNAELTTSESLVVSSGTAIDLGGVGYVEFAHASATTVSAVSNVVAGKTYAFKFNNGNTTISTSILYSDGGSSVNPTASDVMMVIGGSGNKLYMAAKLPNNS